MSSTKSFKGLKVFISHSNKDKPTIELLCSILEKKGLRCWVAPRNIQAGARFPAAIMDGIETSDVFLVMISENSNESKYVPRELEIADAIGIPIIPVCITAVANLHPAIKLLCNLLQMFKLYEGVLEERCNSLGDIILGISGMPPRIEPKPTMMEIGTLPKLKTKAPYPLALSINAVIEQEINPKAEAYDSAIFNLVDVFVKFCGSVLIALYRSLPDDQISAEFDAIIAEISNGQSRSWVKIIYSLPDTLKDKNGLPEIGQKISGFLGSQENLHSLQPHLKQLSEQVPVVGFKAYTLRPQVLFLALALEYQTRYFQKKIANSESIIKIIRDGMAELIAELGKITDMKIAAIKSFWPDKSNRTFVHNITEFVNLKAVESDRQFTSSNWDIIDPRHIILYGDNLQSGFIDLFPFMIASETFDDILLWEKTEDFTRIVSRQLRDCVAKDMEVGQDKFLSRIKTRTISKTINVGDNQETPDIMEAINSVRQFIVEKVKNPQCKIELEGRLKSLEEHLEADFQKAISVNINAWIDKLSQIKVLGSKGCFPKLEPTEHDYILTDENKGKYIVPELFFNAHPQLQSEILKSTGIAHKATSKEVGVILYLGIAEAAKNNGGALGVEHLMIAASKLCSRLILDWYDAIGIPPKHHRDLTRKCIDLRSEGKELKKREGLSLKPRLIRVLEMAVEEANLANRETILLVDVFSAILREGYSVSIKVLTNYYGIPRDRLLSEYYSILRKTS